MKTFRLDAIIKIIGGNPYVGLPASVLEGIFKQGENHRGPIPVRGRINGAEFRQSLVRWRGEWRLYVNTVMAKAGGLKFTGSISSIVGRRVRFELAYDPEPPRYEMIPELERALDLNHGAKAAFEALTPGRQKEILRYLGSLKSREAIERNVERVLQHLTGKETDALHALMHHTKNASMDDYIKRFPSDEQKVLQRIRRIVSDVAPDAKEAMSYGIPSFKIGDKYLIYFAGYTRHISVYPVPPADSSLKAAMHPYLAGKGTLKFPLDQEIPYDLITRVTQAHLKRFPK